MTPIDTRLRAHDELRKRLTAYRDAKALYESPDPYDREEARYEAMHLTLRRIGYDSELAQGLLDEHGALLDEVDRLRAIFDDAGQGEHNVLALVEHYQDCVSKAEDELASAAAALGAGWLAGGATLAQGIERKTRALEGLNATPPELTPADPMLPTVAVPRDLVEAIVDDLRQGLAIEQETGEALAELLEGGAS